MVVKSDFAVWDGVFGSFAEAPAVGPGFDGAIWRDRSVQAARETLAHVRDGVPLDYGLRQRNSALPILTAMLLVEQSCVRILDLGGGLATGYMVLLKAVPNAVDRVEYTVVEGEGICLAGRELFANAANPAFRTGLPETAQLDIAHAASVMQYIDDWRGVIEKLAAYGAPYLSLGDLFIGDFQTFVTQQRYYGSRIPHWFFNAGDFIGEVERRGYVLASRMHCDAKILGQYGPLPMDNFPSELRIAHTSNLLFRRQSKVS